MQTIPLFFTFNERYVIAAIAAFYSLLEKASPNYYYKLYVLHTDIKGKSQQTLTKLVCKFPNASLEFINTSSFDSGGWSQLKYKEHFSKEIFYKLIAAEVFPQYDRIICSDVDVIFLGNISESYFLYKDEFFYFAGVKSPIYSNISKRKYAKYFNDTELEILRHEISAGYLLINLKAIRENCKQKEMVEYYKSNLHRLILPEQNCIILTCYPYLKDLPVSYVVATYYYKLNIDKINFNMKKFSNRDMAVNSFKEALNNPIQLHYAGHKKPWNSFFIPKWRSWIKVISKSGFFFYYLKMLPLSLSLFSVHKIRKYSLKRFINKMQCKIM
ncbi:hypothetical protein EZS27_033929, partial [termite gut metagenome]